MFLISCFKPYLRAMLFWGWSFSVFSLSPLNIVPVGSTVIQNTQSGETIVKYQVTNQMKKPYQLMLQPLAGVTQITGADYCSKTFTLFPHASCILALQVNRSKLSPFSGGPVICLAKGNHSSICFRPSPEDLLKVENLDPLFPYGASPVGNVCVSSDYYATPETMLGSWAMLQAVSLDVQGGVLPTFMNTNNTVYAVGTAAIGDQLGIPGCSGGCNELNGYCFALKFNDKPSYPYMIFQSVNIGANNNSFDIYMAGGGSGAFPTPCREFWGTGSSVNWANHIEDSSCDAYFGDYSSINSSYVVTYKGVNYTAKDTLKNACAFASNGQSGFNSQNWSNVSVIAVSCPSTLTQISGVQIPSTITTIGNQTIKNLSTLTDNDFASSTVTGVTTTQMQDCKTPSSGYCGNVSTSVTNYEASISASLSAPLLEGTPPSSTYCQTNINAQFCSWNNGISSAGGSYCNANSAQCISCGNGAKWCVCDGTTLKGCQAGILG